MKLKYKRSLLKKKRQLILLFFLYLSIRGLPVPYNTGCLLWLVPSPYRETAFPRPQGKPSIHHALLCGTDVALPEPGCGLPWEQSLERVTGDFLLSPDRCSPCIEPAEGDKGVDNIEDHRVWKENPKVTWRMDRDPDTGWKENIYR